METELAAAALPRQTGIPRYEGGHARLLKGEPGAALDPSVKAKLREKANDFETMFLSQMLAPMFDTLEVDETFGGGHGEEMFRSLLTNEYAKQISSNGKLGIADQVYSELLRAQEANNG
jgi:peptidoglycan hydrolase FlgJ